jgi:hypothetical protein
MKLLGLVLDDFLCFSLPFVLIGASNLLQKCKISFSSYIFVETVLSGFSFSLSFLGFFSAFYYTPWILVGFGILE